MASTLHLAPRSASGFGARPARAALARTRRPRRSAHTDAPPGACSRGSHAAPTYPRSGYQP
eukprot:15103256-Alexandrium_andersonii.AAC.1